MGRPRKKITGRVAVPIYEVSYEQNWNNTVRTREVTADSFAEAELIMIDIEGVYRNGIKSITNTNRVVTVRYPELKP